MHHTTNHVKALALHHIFILAQHNFFLFLLYVKYYDTEKFNDLLPFSHVAISGGMWAHCFGDPCSTVSPV